MNEEEESRIFRDAMELWGTHAQMHMIVEEAAELIKAVCKMERASSNRHDAFVAFVDELVDCQIMIEQFIPEVGQEAFSRARDLKMKRLKEKLFVYSEAHRTKPEMPWPAHINLRDFM